MGITIQKQALIQAIAAIASQKNLPAGVPLTDIALEQNTIDQLETQTISLENLTPNPQPLLNSPELLDGIWQLIYSTAREIRTLTTLPLGFKLGKVYQAIDAASGSFFNQAFCRHSSHALAGYVTVTATFSPAPTPTDTIPHRKINVDFQQRSIFIQEIFGFKIPATKPVKVVDARNPVGRIPSLTITYLDESLRIGRGGDGSLFILLRASALEP
jgi:hypothetical protein